MSLGGSWKRDSQIDQQDSIECTQWYGLISNTMNGANTPQSQRGSFINAYMADPACFECPCCTVDMNADDCMCQLSASAKRDGCGPLWTSFKGRGTGYNAKLADPTGIQKVGDMTDPIASAQAVSFVFHHCNVERHFQEWLRRHIGSGGPASVAKLRSLNYLGYPTSGLGLGGNLHDVMSTDAPFFGLFPNEQEVIGRVSSLAAPYTAAEALELAAFGVDGSVYRYDSYTVTAQSRTRVVDATANHTDIASPPPLAPVRSTDAASLLLSNPTMMVVGIAVLLSIVTIGIGICVRLVRKSREKFTADAAAAAGAAASDALPISPTPVWARAPTAPSSPRNDWRPPHVAAEEEEEGGGEGRFSTLQVEM